MLTGIIAAIGMSSGPRVGLVAASTLTYATSTSQNATVPAAAMIDDLLLAWVMHRDVLSAPVGWVLVESQSVNGGSPSVTQILSVYQRTCQSGDPGSVTAWGQATSQRIAVQIMALRSTDGTTPQVAHSARASQPSSAGLVATMAIATATGDGQIGIAGATFIQAGSGGSIGMAASTGYSLTTPTATPENRFGIAYRRRSTGQQTSGTLTQSGYSTAVNGIAAVSVVVGV